MGTAIRKLLVLFLVVTISTAGIVLFARFGSVIIFKVDARGSFEQAKGFVAEGHLDQAVEQFQQALRLDAGLEDARRQLVAALRAGGRLEEAALEAATAAESGDAASRRRSLEELAVLQRELGEPGNSKDTLLAVIAEFRGTSETYFLLAQAHAELAEYAPMMEALRQAGAAPADEASEDYQKMRRALVSERDAVRGRIRSGDATPAAYYRAGILERDLGNWEEAVSMFTQAVAAGAAPADAHFWLGVAAEISGDKAAARDHYAQAIAALPSHRGAALGAARCAP